MNQVYPLIRLYRPVYGIFRSFSTEGPTSHPKTPKGRLDIDEKGENSSNTKTPTKPADKTEPEKANTNPYTGEINGPKGPEPTRYGDWERKGRVTDF